MKALKSKTINFAALLAAFGVIETQLPQIQDSLGDYYGFILIAVGAIVASLRVVTKVPLSDK